LQTDDTIHHATDHLFRRESARLVALLTGIFGIQHLQLAEDVVQDTLVKALEQWKINGLPANPGGWLYRVAKNKAIDVLRREKHKAPFPENIDRLLQADSSPAGDVTAEHHAISDDQLRMMFTCCHPGISVESQLALVLKTLCGFSVTEISKAFLTPADTIEKRLYRSREFFRENRVAFEIPDEMELPARMDNVLMAIYLLFNEGYNSTQHASLIREDLLEESFRLAEWLARHPLTKQPRICALLAQMSFTRARTPARVDENGNILLLKEQDRSKWDRHWIERGIEWLDQCAQGDLTSYHLEAGIAYEYIRAPSYERTNWQVILGFYDLLYEMKPTPVVALNRAVVLGEWKGYAEALAYLEKQVSPKELENYYLYHAVMGEFLERNDRGAEALNHYEKARSLTRSGAEKNLLERKIARISNHSL